MVEYSTSVSKADFHPETVSFFNGKRVFVPGGTGFIGSHVVEQLLKLNARPIVLTRQRDPVFLRNVQSLVPTIVGDLESKSDIQRAAEGCSIVLNLAASVAGIEYNKAHPATIFRDNMRIFLNIMDVSAEMKMERVLVTSSACVYPRHCSIPTPESEGFVGEPEPTNSGYGWVKRMEEILGKKYQEEFGLSVSVARPYNAYGPRDNFNPATSHVIPALIYKAFQAQNGQFEVWGTGSHSRSFLYVDDFARGLVEVAARLPTAEAVNIGCDEEITIQDLANLICESFEELKGKKLAPVFNSLGTTGQPRRKCDTTMAARLLGYNAKVAFKDGLKNTIKWFYEHNQ